MLKLGWFSSGGEGSRHILEQVMLHKAPQWKIDWVFMNKNRDEDENSIKYARLCDFLEIPLYTFSWKDYRKGLHFSEDSAKDYQLKWSRKWYDEQVNDMLWKNNCWNVQYVFMAGYMRIITKELFDTYFKVKFINLHPGLPGGPKGTYKEVIEQLKSKSETGFITTGSMTHYVNEVLDGGQPLLYFKFTCPADYGIIREETLKREPFLLLKTMEYLDTPIEIEFKM